MDAYNDATRPSTDPDVIAAQIFDNGALTDEQVLNAEFAAALMGGSIEIGPLDPNCRLARFLALPTPEEQEAFLISEWTALGLIDEDEWDPDA